MKNTFFNSGMLAVLLAFALALGSCVSISESVESQAIFDAAVDFVTSYRVTPGDLASHVMRGEDFRVKGEDFRVKIENGRQNTAKTSSIIIEAYYGGGNAFYKIEFTQRIDDAGNCYVTRILRCTRYFY